MTIYRKRLFWAVLFILLLNIAAVQNIRVGFTQETPPAVILVSPPEIKDESYGVGSTFTVDISIVNATNIYGYQINMTFNPEVVNTTEASIVEGWFLSDYFGDTVFVQDVDNAAGFLAVTGSDFPPYPGEGVSGDGLLMSITFKVKAANRGTLLQFVEGTRLYTVISGTPVEIVDFSTFDGSFDNRLASQNVSPIALFEVKPLDASKRGEVRFDASGSSDPDAWLVSYHWSYGDGVEEVFMRDPYGIGNFTAKPAHVFHQNGTFTVTLTAKDNDNATDDAIAQVTVLFDLAVLNVESPYILVMAGVPVTVDVTVANYGDFYETFNVTAYYNETLIELRQITNMAPWTQQTLTYNWNTTGLGLGKYILKANATVLSEETYADNNEYIDGSVTIASSNVIDLPIEVGGVTFHVVANTTSIIFGQGFSSSGKSLDFTASGQEGTSAYCNITIPIELLGGNYTVLQNGLTFSSVAPEVTNGTHAFLYFEYTHTAPNIIEIIGQTAATPPVAILVPSKRNPLINEVVTFDGSGSYDPDGFITSWSWDFGDGNVATGATVQHSYAAFGYYQATLTVQDNSTLGYIESTDVAMTVIWYPTANFTFSPSDPFADETVSFDASGSKANGGSITDYSWSFGDGQTGTGSTATHAYLTTGTFTVTLTVTDSEDLTNSTSKTVTVTIHNVAVTSVTASSAAVEKGGTITLQIIASNKGNYTESFTVTAYYNTTRIKTEPVTSLNAGGDQSITIVWNTASAAVGTYVLKVEASVVEEETRTGDNSFVYGSVAVQKITSAVSIAASSTTVTLGRNTIIHGILGPVRIGTSITIQYRLNGGEWAALATVISDAQAQYMLNWRPQESGTYEVQAVWLGDVDTKSCQSTTETIIVQEGGGLSTESILTYGGIIAAIVALILMILYLLRLRKK